MNKVEVTKKLTNEQQQTVESALKKTVKQYRVALLRLALT